MRKEEKRKVAMDAIVSKNNEVRRDEEGGKEMKNTINEELKTIKQTETTIDRVIANKLLGRESGLLKKEFDTYDGVIKYSNTIYNIMFIENTVHIVLDMINELEEEYRAKVDKLYNKYFRKVKELAIKETRKKEIAIKKRIIDELKEKVLDIAMTIICNSYLDTIEELVELDSIMVDIPDFQYFYDKVLEREEKIELEEGIMEDLANELEYNEDYVIGYDGGKPKIILDDEYYYNNLDFYEENYKDYEFITARKRLLDGEYVLELLNSDNYKDLIDELTAKVFDIAMLIIDNCYLDTTDELEELDRILVSLPEYQNFYNEVINKDAKIDLEEELMEDLAMELKYREGYVIGYDGDKPKIIIDERYYNKNHVDYEDEYYENIEFKKTGPDFI